MDKGETPEKKLLRPVPSLQSRTNKSLASTEQDKSGAQNGSTSITGDFMKKISSNVMSPLTSNRPGRLASFRTERDLTLGSSKIPSPSLLGASGGTKPKKVFTPTIPARKGRVEDGNEKQEDKEEKPSVRGRNRREGQVRGRGRGRPELIQITGSVFGEGIGEGTAKRYGASSSGSYSRGDSSSGALEKPRLNTENKVIDKESEDATLKQLLRDDFIGDSQFTDDSHIIPIQLPKTSLSSFLKVEEEQEQKQRLEAKPQIVGNVEIKQEKDDDREEVVKTEKPAAYHRRLEPLQIVPVDLFNNDDELIFFQLPDVLPTLKVKHEKITVKTEPGKEKADESNVDDTKTEDEGLLYQLPEGRLGTLQIHESGRLSMKLGDHMFVIDSGTQVSFVQELISVRFDEETKGGDMTALGPIKCKAVCVPDWEKLIED